VSALSRAAADRCAARCACAASKGGALRLGHCAFRLSNLVFEANTAQEGAAIHVENPASVLSISACTFKNNR
jgi:hypothetical protein